jgi:hypothetical protein
LDPHARIAKIGLRKENPQMRGTDERKKKADKKEGNKS